MGRKKRNILVVVGALVALCAAVAVVVALSSRRPPHPLLAPQTDPGVQRAIARLGELPVLVESDERRSEDDPEQPLERVARDEAEYVLELLGFEPLFISHKEVKSVDALLVLSVSGRLRSMEYRSEKGYEGRMDTGYGVRVSCSVGARDIGGATCVATFDKDPPDRLSESEARQTEHDYEDTVEQGVATAILGAVFKADTSRIASALDESGIGDEAWNALALIGPPALPLLIDAAGSDEYGPDGPATALFWMWRKEEHRDKVLAELRRVPQSPAAREGLAGLWLRRGISPSSRRRPWFVDYFRAEEPTPHEVARDYLRLLVAAYPDSPEAEKARATLKE